MNDILGRRWSKEGEMLEGWSKATAHNEWQFTEGGLEDNKIKFCPYCSGKIAAPKPESE